jgi:lysine-N-methylase
MFESLRPLYAKKFRCIGAACEDVCCRGWEVTVDRATYEKYESHPAMHSQLKERFTLITEEGSDHNYARINFTTSSTCPFFSPEHQCTIHRDFGEAYLSEICSNYPRISRRIDGLIEKPLVLSCPEAARIVLLDPALLPGYRQREGTRGYGRLLAMSDLPVPRSLGALRFFWEIREFCLVLLQDPTYNLWQRLFILGMFCKKLNELERAGDVEQIPRLLRDYAQIAVDGRLKDAMNGIPVRLDAQVRMVLEVVHLYLATRGSTQVRLRQCLQDFLDGIQYTNAPNVESCARHYAEGYANYYAPLVERHPHLMENYLVNYVLLTRFPFAHEVVQNADPQTEYVFMCLEYSIVKGLLIGMAMHAREGFSLEHVVKLVQNIAKALEHNNPIRSAINWKGLSEPISMAALLKN